MQKFLAPALSVIALLAVGVSYFLFYSLNKKVNTISNSQNIPVQETTSIDSCGEVCKTEIERAVSAAIATISATPQTIVKSVPAPSKNQTVYIPLDGPLTTTSTSWVDIPGVELYIDLANDYSSKAVVTWEASLKVKDGNGQAFARLQDITHGISVNGSEISTSNNANAQIASSGNLSFWAGRNLYRLQLKSLNSFEVTFLSGRIKISY